MSAIPSKRVLEQLRALTKGKPPAEVQRAIYALVQTLDEREAEAVLFDWEGVWARPSQIEPPGDWSHWLIIAGRGFGKTRAGAEWVKKQLEEMPGCRVAIVARTIADARDTCVEGESGLLSCFPADKQPTWHRALGEGVCDNGSSWKIFTSEKPGSLRGPQFHVLWADELAAWEKQRAAWQQVPYTVRLPWAADPKRAGRVIITTTPQPFLEIRELLKDPTTVVTRGTTFENWHNLNAIMRAKAEKLRGTRMGRQELLAEMLDDVQGALWARQLLDKLRRPAAHATKMLFERIIVGVDPAISSTEDSDETGIVVVGLSRGKRYVLEDVSLRGKPVEWATAAVDAYHRWKADGIVAEANQGGEMVAGTIAAVDGGVPVRLVHASRGKRTRAEPVATAYERSDCAHLGTFERLEDQMCTWIPGEESPDRMDALVWAMTDLEQADTGAVEEEPGAPQRMGLGAQAL